MSILKRLAIAPIRFYQFFLSPWLGRNCRFFPSCSNYTIEAIEKQGTAKGIWLGAKRICRCHPWNPGGYDPVPEPKAQPPARSEKHNLSSVKRNT